MIEVIDESRKRGRRQGRETVVGGRQNIVTDDRG